MKVGNKKFIKLSLILIVSVLLQACVGKSEGLSKKNSRDAALYNAQLGAGFMQKGDLEQARDKLERALSQDKNNALAHLVYGQLQHKVENPEKAKTHFIRAIELEPDTAGHRNSYGVFLCQTKDYAGAEEQFKAAANNKFYKTPEFAWDNAGVCMLEADKLDKAEGYLRKALQINPTFANTYLHMAELLYKHERLTVADAYFQRFMSYGSDTPESLLLGVYINRDNGNEAQAESFATRLLNDFPTSLEAGEYIARPLQ